MEQATTSRDQEKEGRKVFSVISLMDIMEDSNDIAALHHHTGGGDGPVVHLGGIQISFN